MSRAYRIGLLGVGPMAAQHARAIGAVEGLEVSTSISRDPSKAKVFASEHGIERSVGLAEFLEGPDVDGIYAVVPADSMSAVAVDLSRLGLPLFLEKPVGLSPMETRHACELITVPHMVGMNRRFYEIIQRGKELLQDSGGVTGIEIQMPEFIRELDTRYGNHILEAWMYGNSIHLIDLFRYFAGEPTEVYPLQSRRSWHDRSIVASLAFGSGALGVFHAHWGAPGGWRVTVSARDTQIVFQPIEKALVLQRGKENISLLPEGPDKALKAGLYGEAEAFRHLIHTGKLSSPAADMTDYLKSVELVGRLFNGNSGAEEYRT